MKNTIVHPTDFSECANVALDYAIEVAKILKCKINIVHSLDFRRELNVEQSATSILRLTSELEQAAEIKLKELRERVLEHNITCEAKVYAVKIDSWLPEYISKNKPMLVVMGTTGENSISNKIFGSNTYSVIKNSKSPVLAIPESARLTGAFKNFVMSTDYRDEDIEAIMLLARLAKPSKAEINVVHILNEKGSKKINNKRLIDDLELRVKEKEDYFNINYDLLYNENPESRLKILVEEKKPDILTLVMKKQGFFERLFFGSLTEKLVHKGNVALLVISAD